MPGSRVPTDADCAALLEHVPIGACIVDPSCQILVANAAARAVFEQRDGLALGRDGRLVTGSATATARLRSSVTQLGGTGGVFSLARPSGPPPLCLRATALSGRRIAIVIVAPRRTPEGFERTLRGLYRLSPAEAGVASGILEGRTLAAIARERGVSRTTVRTQLDRILEKTSTRRQSELIRLLSEVTVLAWY